MKLSGKHRRSWRLATMLAVLMLLPSVCALAGELSVDELKDRVANVGVPDRPPLCIQISERQLEGAGKLFTAGDSEKAEAALVDVVAFSGLARDYAIEAHKHEKQSEIAIRKMIRKLDGLKHLVAHEDEKPIEESIQHLEQIRDDLLTAMFPHGVRK
jgi:hypothetical protein